MPLDRSDAVNKAASLASRGAFEAALAEYLRLFRDNPKDWSVGNALGDVYVRLGKSDAAVLHFVDLAEHLASDGFVAKARALYRKILRIQPNHDSARQRVEELDRQQVAQASPFLQRVLETAGGAPRPAPAAVPPAVGAPPQRGATPAPHVPPDAAPAERPEPPAPMHPANATPTPTVAAPTRSIEIVSETIEVATVESQSSPLRSITVVEHDEWISVPLAERPLTSPEPPRSSFKQPPTGSALPSLVYAFEDAHTAVDAAVARRDFTAAATVLERFLQVQPHHVGALERLIEVTIDGRLQAQAIAAQVRLADACIRDGRFLQARHVAIDLVLREPDRFDHRALADRIEAAAREHGVALPPRPAIDPVAPGQSSPPTLPAEEEAALQAPDAASAEVEIKDDLERAFADVRDGLLEDAAAAAEERFAESARLIDANALDEAVRALEVAMSVPHLRAPAGSRLARIYRDRGAPEEALACLEWVAEVPPPTAESSHELAYELALTLEALGLRTEALGVYRELLAEVGPDYRDVAARAEDLAAA